jgi:hypothetical protein
VSIIEDPRISGSGTYISSSDFKKEADGQGADAVFSEVSEVKSIMLLASAILAITPATARAQVDLSGFWSNPNFEDVMERIDGPALGDYLGLPLSAAGRRAADTWDASILSIKEHQCQDYPADYQSNSTWSFDMWKDVDPVTHAIVAWRTRLQYMAPERTIWMDDRPHPDEEAPHTWKGSQRPVGRRSLVATTHLKATWLRATCVPRATKRPLSSSSPSTTHLSVVTTVCDPSI